MKKYLSYGGGVNSTAMLLLLLDAGWEFESVYVDHGCDWPETREYVVMMAERYPITILKPNVGRKPIAQASMQLAHPGVEIGSMTKEDEGWDNLYDYAAHYRVIPARTRRWCTDQFKVRVLLDYFETPCFSLIGIDASEEHRAKFSCGGGVENRFPLLEYEIDRAGCIDIIKAHGLPVPIKSGCYFCPFQRVGQWRKLRRIHPELFCKARKMENDAINARLEKGKEAIYLVNDKPLDSVVNEKQSVMWPEMKAPCSCGL